MKVLVVMCFILTMVMPVLYGRPCGIRILVFVIKWMIILNKKLL